ncbi:hypothetical protein ACFQ08_25720 [Streptosporangium algeriense]|uniref:Uncharacterized protein n=1 Tax=Streptosporangium algeriense TaxID=1682748 RepID=A0ABW3DVW0_9ACTN
MSFELAVWQEPEPITAERAAEVLRALRAGDTRVVRPHPGVTEFAAALPEAVVPGDSPAYALVTVDLERSDEVADAAFTLARECGLVCYDPQRGLVHNLAPLGAYPGMQLRTGDGMIVVDPDLRLVADAVATMSPRNPFTALVVFGEHFVQSSPEITGYELEYKDSVADVMVRTHVPEIGAVREAFVEYAEGGRSFLERHDWRRV